MFGSLPNSIGQSNSTQSLFGQSQTSAPFALSGNRNIFSSNSSSNNYSFPNSLSTTSIGLSNSFFSSAFSNTTSNSFFPNSPRGEMFTSLNSFSPNISSSSFALGNSAVFPNQSKVPSLGLNSQTSSGIFNQTSIFNNTTGPGTPIPFRAVQSQDTVMKGGTQVNVQVRLECIPAMKEYENKSLEELRYEDYLSGRRGNTIIAVPNQNQPNQGIFSNQALNNSSNNRGLFGSNSGSNFFSPNPASQNSNLFTPKYQAPLFGQGSQNKSFGISSNSLFPNNSFTQTSNVFNPQNAPQNNSFPPVISTSQNTTGLFFNNPSNLQGVKSNFVVGSNQSSFNLGANQFQKSTSLFNLQPNTANVPSNFFPQQSNQIGLYSSRPLDLSYRKSGSSILANSSIVNSPIQNLSTNNPIMTNLDTNIESPIVLEKQLLLLARTPFGDSPLFRDASQTIDSVNSTAKRNAFKSVNEFSLPLTVQPSPPSNIFKIKINPNALVPKECSLQNISLLGDIDKKLQSQKSLQENVLISRKISVKQLNFPSKSLSNSLSIDDSVVPSDIARNINQINLPHTNIIINSENVDTLTASGKDPIMIDNDPPLLDLELSNFKLALKDDFHIEHVLLTIMRHDYYTSPSCFEISSQISSNNKIVVSNFTIYRQGYGQIYFPGSSDITGLDIDKNVFIERKEVSVYPNEKQKPKYGEKLNKEAYISLYEVWPICKTTREAITDPSKILALRYYEKVERCTEKLGAHFIDYEPKEGIWKFKVLHFSKYKLDISDSSDSDEIAEEKSIQVMDKVMERDSKKRKNSLKKLPKRHDVSDSIKENSKLHFEMNILFSTSDALPKNPPLEFPDKINDISFEHFKKSGRRMRLNDPDWKFPHIDVFHPLISIQRQESILLPVIQNFVDSSLFINRGFRATWNYFGKLVVTIQRCSNVLKSSFSIRIVKFDLTPKKSFDLFSAVPLNNFFENLHKMTDSDRFGTLTDHYDIFTSFSPFHTSEFSHQLITLASHCCKNNENLIWELFLILLSKKTIINMAYSDYLKCYDSISQWLSLLNNISPFFGSLFVDDFLFEIMQELLKGDIYSACLLALDKGDYQLAHVISQSFTHRCSREKGFFSAQILAWLSSNAINYISPYRFVLYCILSGEIGSIFAGNVSDIFLHLKWFHCFALIFWFTQSPNSNISEILLSFDKLCDSNCFPYPSVSYLNSSMNTGSTPDILYNLISFSFSNYSFSKVLKVSSYSSLPLDYSLSFLILLTFSDLKQQCVLQLSNIVMSFASQLIILGLWKWGIYILFFLPPSAHKIAAIYSLINRCCISVETTSKEETFILKDLKIPLSTIFYSKSNYAFYYKKYLLHSDFSIEAKLPDVAHKTLINHIVYPCIINGNYELIKAKIREIEYPGRINLIEHWEIEGSIYLDYVRIFETIRKLLDGYRCSAIELQDLLQGIRSLCHRISQEKRKFSNRINFLAISEISKNLVLFLKMLVTIENNSLDNTLNISRETIHYFTNLPLLCDNLSGICNDMCESYLDDIR